MKGRRQTLNNREAIEFLRAYTQTEDGSKWLCRFANTDLSTLGATEKDSLPWEVRAFAFRSQGAWQGKPLQRGFSPEPVDGFRLPAPFNAEKIQRELREFLSSYVEGRACLRQGKGPFVHGLRRRSDGGAELFMNADPESEFFAQVFLLLAQLGDKFRCCAAASCRNFFVAKPRQLYCSSRCAGRERASRFDKKHPGRLAAIKREAYVRAQRKRSGPKVKVERRRRES